MLTPDLPLGLLYDRTTLRRVESHSDLLVESVVTIRGQNTTTPNIAQLVEPWVGGSNPPIGSLYCPVRWQSSGGRPGNGRLSHGTVNHIGDFMLPEQAWGLKRGERIVGTNPVNKQRFEGVVDKILKIGQSYQDYLSFGLNEFEARMREHDPPTVVLFDGSQYILFNPQFVELVLNEFKFTCVKCRSLVIMKLRGTEFPQEIQTMILNNRCTQCINLP